MQRLDVTTDHKPLPSVEDQGRLQGEGGGAPMWSVAVHWVHWPWGFLGGAGQGQTLPVFCLGPPYLNYKEFEMAATCAGLGDSQGKPSCDSRLAASSAVPGTH